MSRSVSTTRIIRKSHNYSSREAADLLGAILAAEVASPSTTLWMVSPWISDVPALDNTSGAFPQLNRWGMRGIGLAEVLATVTAAGCTVVVGTTPDRHNRYFLERLRSLTEDLDTSANVVIDIDARNELHTKSVIGDDFVIVGSMNLTMNGVFLREEYVELKTGPEEVTQARLDAAERFGGPLS